MATVMGSIQRTSLGLDEGLLTGGAARGEAAACSSQRPVYALFIQSYVLGLNTLTV